MGPIEALELALRKEIDAKNTYEKLYEQFPEIKDIFMFLMNEEEKHQHLIQKKISELEIG